MSKGSKDMEEIEAEFPLVATNPVLSFGVV